MTLFEKDSELGGQFRLAQQIPGKEEFAETIRADNNLSQLPVIALSSLVSPAAIERGRQAGFHDYVAKFDRPGLIAALKEQTTEINQAA